VASRQAAAQLRAYVRVLAARMPKLCQTSPSDMEEGAGNAGCWPHPWPASKRKSWRQLPQVQPEQPAFPARWLYGLYRALPGNRAFLLPSPAAFVTPARLTPASGCQDHTILPSASASFVRTKNSRASPKRPSQSRLTCRDDRDAPLFIEAGWRGEYMIFWKTEAKFLRAVESVGTTLKCLGISILRARDFEALPARSMDPSASGGAKHPVVVSSPGALNSRLELSPTRVVDSVSVRPWPKLPGCK